MQKEGMGQNEAIWQPSKAKKENPNTKVEKYDMTDYFAAVKRASKKTVRSKTRAEASVNADRQLAGKAAAAKDFCVVPGTRIKAEQPKAVEAAVSIKKVQPKAESPEAAVVIPAKSAQVKVAAVAAPVKVIQASAAQPEVIEAATPIKEISAKAVEATVPIKAVQTKAEPPKPVEVVAPIKKVQAKTEQPKEKEVVAPVKAVLAKVVEAVAHIREVQAKTGQPKESEIVVPVKAVQAKAKPEKPVEAAVPIKEIQQEKAQPKEEQPQTKAESELIALGVETAMQDETVVEIPAKEMEQPIAEKKEEPEESLPPVVEEITPAEPEEEIAKPEAEESLPPAVEETIPAEPEEAIAKSESEESLPPVVEEITPAEPEEAAAKSKSEEPLLPTEEEATPSKQEEETDKPEPKDPMKELLPLLPEKTETAEKKMESGTDKETEKRISEIVFSAKASEKNLDVERAEQIRIADMTRTVQISIEQILQNQSKEEEAHTDGAAEQAEEAVDEPKQEEMQTTEEQEYVPDTAETVIKRGAFSLLRWMILVAFLVLTIAGCGVYWLYQQAGSDMIPQISVTFAGQNLQVTSYDWQVPVVGNQLKRTYAETLSSKPITLEMVDSYTPKLVLSSDIYETEVEVQDAEGTVIFEGSAKQFNEYTFEKNGEYTVQVTVKAQSSDISGSSDVSGGQTYWFAFALEAKPSIRLNSDSISQGGVVAVRVENYYGEQLPQLKSELASTVFTQNGEDYLAFVPVPMDAEIKAYTVYVTAGKYSETFTVNVKDGNWRYRDCYSSSQMYSPYVGGDSTPQEVTEVLRQTSQAIGWAAKGFAQPFVEKASILLPYGMTEYVGRSSSQKANNEGTGRQAANILVETTYGSDVISPADGVVVLAEDLGDTAGCTVVVDHGGGVRSVFYNLSEIKTEKGKTIKQGDILGAANRYMCCGVAIGTASVEPTAIWKNQCDALKFY